MSKVAKAKLPKELEFILQDELPSANEPISAYWLLSDFEATVWNCRFGAEKFQLDFNIQLENGTKLTDVANRRLLELFKRFICLQSSDVVTKGRPRKTITDRGNVQRAVHIVDYLLVRAEKLRLGAVGLARFDEDEAHRFTATLCQGKHICAGLYAAESVISGFLRKVLLADDEGKLNTLFLEPLKHLEGRVIEDLEALPSESAFSNFTLAEINRLRKIFMAAGWYRKMLLASTGCYEFERKYLIGAAYDRRVLTEKKRLDAIDLSVFDWSPPDFYVTEYPRAPVQTGADDERALDEHVDSYLRAFCSADYFLRLGEPLFSAEALSSVRHIRETEGERLKSKGRFAIVPFEIADFVLGQSIDIIYRNGEDVVRAVTSFCSSGVLLEVPKIRKASVIGWQSERQGRFGKSAGKIREALGAFEALEVLVGCVICSISSMTANRMEEMETLPTDCIYLGEDGRWYLRLRAGKKNVQEQHQLRDKPIPPLVVDGIKLLQRIQQLLKEAGFDLGKNLFQLPLRKLEAKVMRPMSREDMGICLDRMCDFVEVPLDGEGRRYYVRPHQIRRVTGYLFFWAGFKGGIEMLGKFLGHGSLEETQRYCTEAMKGKALRHVKAVVAARAVHEDLPPAKALSVWLSEQHEVDVHTLSVMEVDAIADWIDAAIAAKKVDVAVEAVTNATGESFRTVVLIKDSKQ